MLLELHRKKSSETEEIFRSLAHASTCSSNFKQSIVPSKDSDSFISDSSSEFCEFERHSDIETYKKKFSRLKTNIEHELASLKSTVAGITNDRPKARKPSRKDSYHLLLDEKRYQSDLVVSQIIALDQENSALRQQIKALKSKKEDNDMCKCSIF